MNAGSSKILTVSYGTFSCTLEGFDEPFNTMKAIAEYFRDLAADDRYFGAEPPQPDAEMLHRIAEREIQRRVEAKIERNGVVLRPSGEMAAAALTSPPVPEAPRPPMSETMPPSASPSAPLDGFRPVDRPSPPAAEATSSVDPISESVAAKLQRIRTAVAHARTEQANVPARAIMPEAEPEAPDEALDTVSRYATEPDRRDNAENIEPMTEDAGFGFSLDISGPLSAEETAEIAAPAEPAPEAALPPDQTTADDIEAAAAAQRAAEQAEEQAAAEYAATRAEAEAEHAEYLALERQRRRAERRAARIAAAEAEQVARARQLRAAAEARQAAADAQSGTGDDVPDAGQDDAADAAAATPEAKPEGAVTTALSAPEDRETEETAETAPEETTAEVADVQRTEAQQGEARQTGVETAATEEAVAALTASPEMPALPPVAEDAPSGSPTAPEDRAAEDTAPGTAADAPAAPPAEPPPPEPVSAMPPPATRPTIRVRVIKLLRSATAPRAPEALPPEAPGPAAPAATQAPIGDETAAMPAAISTRPEGTPDPDSGAQNAAIGDAPSMPVGAEADDTLMAELATLAEDLPDDSDWGSLAAVQPAQTTSEPAGTPEAAAERSEPDAAPPMTATDLAPAEDAPRDAADTAPRNDPRAEPHPETMPVSSTAQHLPRTTPGPVPEGDLSRLLEKAEAQMSGTENRRRISAIAHLKAAVAATVAERSAAPPPSAPAQRPATDETEPYRQDLHQAVRPRRPSDLPRLEAPSAGTQTARPEPVPRPEPLILVSEQRIDHAPERGEAQSVRPRRVSAASLQQAFETVAAEGPEPPPAAPEMRGGFAEFARARAPQGLAELLEAAAAYTAQVEGRPHFSPPQIMSKVSAIEEAEFSREDRLRMFGTLLRQGKIAKIKRGQYAITEASRFFERRA